MVTKLRKSKAPGWDNITAECIMYGGDIMIETLCKLSNLITKMEYVPWQYRIGLLVPIPKSDKNKLLQDNYRGITLLPVLRKVLESCYMCRIEDWAKANGLIINIQGASQPHCSSLQTAWLVKEVISQRKCTDKTTYIGQLDISKAFDTIFQEGMIFKLYESGIRGKLWRIVRLLYKDFKCNVMLCGKASESIKTERGIHQGAPCSMFLFTLFLNDLLREMQDMKLGHKLCGLNLNCVAFADDISLVASCKADLQLLVDTAYRYSKNWRFNFSPKKCVVIVNCTRLKAYPSCAML